MVQNLRGTASVLISSSGRKAEKGDCTFSNSKSKVPVSHEISSGSAIYDDCEIDDFT